MKPTNLSFLLLLFLTGFFKLGYTQQPVYSLIVKDTTVYAGTLRGVFSTNMNESNWIASNKGLVSPSNRWVSVSELLIHNSLIYAGSQFSGVYSSNNYGVSWNSSNNGLTETSDVTSFASIDTLVFVCVRKVGLFVTADKGGSWKQIFWSTIDLEIRKIEFIGTTLFATFYNKGIYTSKDFGVTWNEANNGLNLTNKVITSITSFKQSVFVANWASEVYKTENNGLSWTNSGIGLKPNLKINQITVIGERIYIGSNGDGMFVSENNGKDWTEINSGLENKFINAIVNFKNTILIGTDDGIFISSNNGILWTKYSIGLPDSSPPKTTLTPNASYNFIGTKDNVTLSSKNSGSQIQYEIVNNSSIDISVNIRVTITCSGTNPFGGSSNESSTGPSWRVKVAANSTKLYDAEGCSGTTKSFSTDWTVN